jgi:hypothetical protein
VEFELVEFIEAPCRRLVEGPPQLLPLSGEPTVVMLGREVQCGPGFADLVGVDTRSNETALPASISSGTPPATGSHSTACGRQAICVRLLDRLRWRRAHSFITAA